MKIKLLSYSLGVVFYYLLIVFLFEGHRIIFPIFTISAFILGMFLTKKEIIYSFSLITIINFISLFVPHRIISIILIYLVFTPLSFSMGYFLKDKLFVFKFLFPVLLIIIGKYGFINSELLLSNHDARQSNYAPKMIFLTDNGNKIQLDTIKNKILVLDFWTTSCGLCFKNFPEYEKVYLKYSDNPSVNIYAVNIPISRDTIGYAKERIKKYNYKFPLLYADSDSITKQFGFNSTPHLIIIKNGKVRFNGIPVLREDLIVKNIYDEIDFLIDEGY